MKGLYPAAPPFSPSYTWKPRLGTTLSPSNPADRLSANVSNYRVKIGQIDLPEQQMMVDDIKRRRQVNAEETRPEWGLPLVETPDYLSR